jgi:hypothetical protein
MTHLITYRKEAEMGVWQGKTLRVRLSMTSWLRSKILIGQVLAMNCRRPLKSPGPPAATLSRSGRIRHDSWRRLATWSSPVPCPDSI